MRRRFFWSIFGVSSVLVILLAASVVGVSNNVRDRATRAEVTRAGEAIGAVLGDRLDRPAVLRALQQGSPLGDVVGDLSALRRVAGGSDIAFYGVGPQGIIGRNAPFDVSVDLDALRAGKSVLIDHESPAGVSTFVYATPVGEVTQRDVVLVVTVARVAPVDVSLPRGWVVVVLAVAAAVAAVLARLLSARLTRQLETVAEAAVDLSAGDLSARAEVSGSTEVDAVATAFNEMAEGLAASRERERQFLLSVGHDLRTPLTTITGYTEALEDGVADDTEVRRIARVMGVEGRRLRRLIEDVMLLARLESADFDLRPEPVEIGPYLDEVLAPFRDRAATLRITWTQDLPGAVPYPGFPGALDDPGNPGFAEIDPDRVGQVVGNLVENALRHTPEAGSVVCRGGDGWRLARHHRVRHGGGDRRRRPPARLRTVVRRAYESGCASGRIRVGTGHRRATRRSDGWHRVGALGWKCGSGVRSQDSGAVALNRGLSGALSDPGNPGYPRTVSGRTRRGRTIPTMLEPIVETTRKRVADLRPHTGDLRARALAREPARSLQRALLADGLGVIAELKRRSPSRGVLAPDLDPATRAKEYEEGGAAAISVLTEPDHFDGSVEDLVAVRAASSIPVLRKDFTLDESQIWEARTVGADAVLLIVAILSNGELEHLHGVASEAGLDSLVEIHTAEEAERALAIGPSIVGVNNRDLRTFDIDLATAEAIAPRLTGVPVTVAESGIFTTADAERMRRAGYHAVLVGESLVKSGDPVSAIRELTVP
jgi:indole-3-glycerol phosphate synthase